MASLLTTLTPSLALPTRLTPLKKHRKGRKARHAAKQRVRASEEEEGKGASPKTTTPDAAKSATNPATNSTPAPTSPAATTPQTTAVAEKAKTVGKRLLESMTFRGGAPELVVGRAAMIGIPTWMIYEMTQKEQFLQSVKDHPGLFVGCLTVLAVASLIPIGMGIKREAFGVMTPYAELINGRTALIGILALVLLEATYGRSFF